MLTKHSNIVIAHAPKHTRHKVKAAATALPQIIVTARDPRRTQRKPALATRVVVGGSKVAEPSEAEMQQRHDAADRLWHSLSAR